VYCRFHRQDNLLPRRTESGHPRLRQERQDLEGAQGQMSVSCSWHVCTHSLTVYTVLVCSLQHCHRHYPIANSCRNVWAHTPHWICLANYLFPSAYGTYCNITLNWKTARSGGPKHASHKHCICSNNGIIVVSRF
jgi:hypothetical protein